MFRLCPVAWRQVAMAACPRSRVFEFPGDASWRVGDLDWILRCVAFGFDARTLEAARTPNTNPKSALCRKKQMGAIAAQSRTK